MLELIYPNNLYPQAGCDEAGRGSLAGPVFAAAVILPDKFYHPLLNDSKKISSKNRDILFDIITKEAVSYGVASCSPEEIDKFNILKCSIIAMHRAIEQLKTRPRSIIVDGNRFDPYGDIPHECIIKGDSKYASIAAASILAKVSRDRYIKEISKEFPQYLWDKNMAYPTKGHREAIREYGSCKYHRSSFKLL